MSWIAPRSNAWGRRCRIETTLDPASVRMRCVGSAERSTTVQSFLSAPATKTAKTGKPKKDETAGFGTGRKIVDVARTSAATLRKSELVDAARHLWINIIETSRSAGVTGSRLLPAMPATRRTAWAGVASEQDDEQGSQPVHRGNR